MGLAKTFAATVLGVDATIIKVETHVTSGTLKYFLVGLPDNAVREGQHRVESALKNNHLHIPRKRIIINFAPADIRKEGSAFDLTIAIGVLAASDQLEPQIDLEKFIIMGELSLDGSLHPIKGALPIAIQARKEDFKGIILPKQNANEAAIVNELDVYGVDNLREVVDFINGKITLETTYVNTREKIL